MSPPLPRVLEDLRRTEIVERLRKDPRSAGGLPLGLDQAAAAEAINWGQADFDEPVGHFSAEDRVLLYAYWNQKRHLEELSEAFRQLFSSGPPKQSLIVVDLGCGPFTGGLALGGHLGSQARFDYIGVDRSQAMCGLGEHLASAAERMDEFPRVNRHWVSAISEVDWRQPPGWRPVVVVVSYLLASASLDVEVLVRELNLLLARLSRGETTLVYTNSPKPDPNSSFPIFRDALLRIGFRSVADDEGSVQTERRTFVLRYALFHRRKRSRLPLGGD